MDVSPRWGDRQRKVSQQPSNKALCCRELVALGSLGVGTPGSLTDGHGWPSGVCLQVCRSKRRFELDRAHPGWFRSNCGRVADLYVWHIRRGKQLQLGWFGRHRSIPLCLMRVLHAGAARTAAVMLFLLPAHAAAQDRYRGGVVKASPAMAASQKVPPPPGRMAPTSLHPHRRKKINFTCCCSCCGSSSMAPWLVMATGGRLGRDLDPESGQG